MVSLFIGTLSDFENDDSLQYTTFLGKSRLNDKRVQNSVESTFAFAKDSDALKFPFALYASGIHRYCFWNIYAGLAIFIAILERMVGANKSWALFATPWGFIMDSMGMEVTIFSAGPFLTFLIFLGVFVSFIYYFSYAMGKTYVIELIGSKRLSTKVKDGYLILNEPGIIDYARCLGYAFALTTPVGIIYSLS